MRRPPSVSSASITQASSATPAPRTSRVRQRRAGEGRNGARDGDWKDAGDVIGSMAGRASGTGATTNGSCDVSADVSSAAALSPLPGSVGALRGDSVASTASIALWVGVSGETGVASGLCVVSGDELAEVVRSAVCMVLSMVVFSALSAGMSGVSGVSLITSDVSAARPLHLIESHRISPSLMDYPG